ncbi:MAG: DUF421 domain-containing protein [Lysinibacillus sp.]
MDYIQLAVRTIALYFIVLIIFRLMGKREVGELSLLDLVVFVLMAEVAAIAIDDLDRPFLLAVFPIVLLFVIQYLNAMFILKNKPLRDLVDGDPTIVIKNGQIVEKEMKRQHYNLDDLFQQLREQGISSIRSIQYAYLEQSGKLSVFLDDEPFILPLIVDGFVDEKHLKLIQKDREWLLNELAKQQIYDVEQVFYACFENNSLFVQCKTLS